MRTIHRRTILGWVCLPALRALAAAHFWDSKPASQWTPDEIAEMVGNSPWAKQVTAQYRVALEDNTRARPGTELQQGRGEAKVGECGLVPCGAVMPGKVAVIWESAQPVREAIHPQIPADMNGHYVISVRGLEGGYSIDRLTEGSELSAKGKPAIQPGIVRQRNATWLFAFSKDLMPLDVNDKEVQFVVHTGANLSVTLLRATFNPKEMMYRGTLAL
jgi:hypothetical protein